MVDPLSYFLFQPVRHDCCNKGRGMCYHVLIVKSQKGSVKYLGKFSSLILASKILDGITLINVSFIGFCQEWQKVFFWASI